MAYRGPMQEEATFVDVRIDPTSEKRKTHLSLHAHGTVNSGSQRPLYLFILPSAWYCCNVCRLAECCYFKPLVEDMCRGMNDIIHLGLCVFSFSFIFFTDVGARRFVDWPPATVIWRAS